MRSSPQKSPLPSKIARPGGVFVATDLGRHADDAIVAGEERATAEKKDLTVCYVIRRSIHAEMVLPGMPTAPQDFPPVLKSTAAYRLRKRVAKLTGRTERQFEALVETGAPDEAILAAADDRRASLIVVGGHPRERLDHPLLGSVTERVVRLAHVPVLVARSSRADGPVLVATDFSDPAVPAISAAAAEARRRGVRTILIHSLERSVSGVDPVPVDLDGPWTGMQARSILERRKIALERLQAIRSEMSFEGEILVAEGSASDAILRAAEVARASLIVVGSKGKTGWRRVLLGSVAESVVQRASCSVLVVRLAHTAVRPQAGSGSSTGPGPRRIDPDSFRTAPR
jgi:nucleotide-binding universal stress UspA family protein